jgi:hypothetical protein
MAFRNHRHYKERMYYEPLSSKVFKFPRGNLYAGVKLDIRAELNIVTNVAANIPDFQIARMIKELTIVKGTDTIWQISGEGLALLFAIRNGVEAPGNTGISVAVADNKQGRMSLYLPFSPDDTLRPWDFAMDTRKYDYEMRIQFRDITAAGSLFGSFTGTCTATASENYIDIALDHLVLKPGPDGGPDALTNSAPLMRGLFERTTDVTQSNNQFKIDLPKFKTFRTLSFWATHETNAGQIQGNGSVFNDKITLKDTQEKEYLAELASMVREDTAQRWKVSSLNAGLYEMPIARWGSVVDAEVSDTANELYILTSVVKQTNATAVRIYSDTIERQ